MASQNHDTQTNILLKENIFLLAKHSSLVQGDVNHTTNGSVKVLTSLSNTLPYWKFENSG